MFHSLTNFIYQSNKQTVFQTIVQNKQTKQKKTETKIKKNKYTQKANEIIETNTKITHKNTTQKNHTKMMSQNKPSIRST